MNPHEKLSFPDTRYLSSEDAADQWLAYLYSGAETEAGKIAFSSWIKKDPANRHAFAQAEQLWRDLAPALIHHEDKNDNISARSDKACHADQLRSHWLWGVAATFILGLTILALISHTTPDKVNVMFASQIGEIKTITLPDTSTVTLSADSKLEVTFSVHTRTLNLLRGRAYFEVAPNKNRPFVVNAATTSTTAIGTAFDVNNTQQGVAVAVTHGIVDVKGFRDRAHSINFAKERLTAGQTLHASLHGELDPPSSFEPADSLNWRNGRLVFKGETLAVVTEEVNRFRRKKIRLTDNAMQNQRITLSLPADKTDLFIGAIKKTQPVFIRETDSEIVIDRAY